MISRPFWFSTTSASSIFFSYAALSLSAFSSAFFRLKQKVLLELRSLS